MGLQVGTIAGQEIRENRGGDTVRFVTVNLFDENPETAEWFSITGDDTAPLDGDKVVLYDLGGGNKITMAMKDFVVASIAAGERKIYSRDSGGNVVASAYFKNDGKLQIDCDSDLIIAIDGNTSISTEGTTTVNSKGNVAINATDGADLTATVAGDTTIDSTGDITAKTSGTAIVQASEVTTNCDVTVTGGDVVADGISLKTHYHQGNLGYPTGTPIQSGGGTTPSTPPTTDSDGDLITGSNAGSVSLENHDHPVSGVTAGGDSVTTGPPN